MGKAATMDVVSWCLLLFTYTCTFPHFCSASDITCSCTHNGDKTKCAVAQESRVSDASDCVFSWSDPTRKQSVLANEDEKDGELVESYSIDELVTFKHLNTTTFSRHCPSEVKNEVNCSVISPGPADQEGPTDLTVPPASNRTDGPAEREGDSNRGHMIAVIVVSVFLVILILGVRYSRSKDENPRDTHCCTQLGGIWTRVKTAEADPEAGLNGRR